MKRLLAAVVVSLLAVVPLAGDSWPLERINRSIAKVTWASDEGSCSAFSINERKGYYITAYHCFARQGMFVGGVAAQEIAAYPDYDLAVIGSRARPALKLGPKPTLGDEVLSLGYGYGAPFTTPVVGLVASHSEMYPESGYSVVPLQWQAPTFYNGMSGGPIVNHSGQVVGVVKCGYANLGCAVKYESVAMVIAKYD